MAREGYILLAAREKFTLRGGSRWVNAYRVVDAVGADILQPWMDTAGEARLAASELGIIILDGDPPCPA